MAIPLPEKRFSLSKKTLWRKLQGRKFLPFFLDCRRRHESFFLYLLPFPHIYTSAEFPYQLRTYIRTTNTTSRQKSKHVLVRTKRGRRKRDEQKRPFWHNKVFGCFSFSSLPHALFLVLIRIGKKISFSRKSFVGGRLCQKRLLPLFFICISPFPPPPNPFCCSLQMTVAVGLHMQAAAEQNEAQFFQSRNFCEGGITLPPFLPVLLPLPPLFKWRRRCRWQNLPR